jgi:hypothetical protein
MTTNTVGYHEMEDLPSEGIPDCMSQIPAYH